MSDHGLCRIHYNILCRVAKRELDRFCLEQVIMMGACSVGIDIINLLRSHIRFLHGKLHSHSRAFSVLCRGSDVVCVSGRSVSHQLCVDLRASGLGMFQLFQDNDTRSLAQDKSVSVLVKRT